MSMVDNGRRRAAVALVVTGAAAVAVAACGGSSGGSSNAASSSSSGSSGKAPIKILQIDDVTSATGLSYPAIAESAKATVADINANGGIDGHQIKLTVCDAKVDPNATQSCARQAVQDKVAAVVGSFTQNPARIMPVLQAAKIPYIPSFAFDQSEFSSPVSFPVNAALSLTPGMGLLAGQQCKSSVIVTPDSATTDFSVGLINGALKAEGKPAAKVVKVAQKPGDYSPQVAEAKGTNAQCMISVLSVPNALSFYPSMQQAGSTQRIVGYQGNSVAPQLIEKTPKVLEGALNVDFFPVLSDPKWDKYRAITAKYSDPKKYDFSLAGAQMAYLSVLVFQQAAKAALDAGQPVTASTLMSALNKTTSFDGGGLIPPVNFTQPSPIKGFPRMFNRSVTFEVVKDGKIAPFDGGKFQDTTQALQSVLGSA
jgi:ABC-type branched-subunit amino acid transport system substrate-binding protein